MAKIGSMLVVLVGMGVTATVAAQTVHPVTGRPGPIVPPPANTNANQVRVDPMVLMEARLTRLEHRVAALQATVAKIQPSVTYRCSDNTTSMNSLGVADDCAPLRCKPETGLCMASPRTSNDCAPGFLMDNSVSPAVCVAAPR